MTAKSIKSDGDRYNFIQKFWSLRYPSPDTVENEFQEEHNRRIRFANDNVREGFMDDWKTDRGHIYLAWGPSDKIEHKSQPYPAEIWSYRHMSSEQQSYTLCSTKGNNGKVEIHFSDKAEDGTYHLKTENNILIFSRALSLEGKHKL